MIGRHVRRLQALLRRPGAKHYVLQSLAAKPLGFLFQVLAVRMLGLEDYGHYVFALVIVGFAATIAGLGLPLSLQRWLPGAPAPRVTATTRAAYRATGAAATVGMLAIAAAAAWPGVGADAFRTSLAVLAPLVLVQAVTGLWRAARQADGDTVADAAAPVIGAVTQLIGLAFAWFTPVDRLLLVSAVTLAGAVVGLAAGETIRRARATAPPAEPGDPEPQLVRRSLPTLGVQIGYDVAARMDRAMLGLLASAASVGLYGAIGTLRFTIEVFHGSFVRAFQPLAGRHVRERDHTALRAAYRRYTRRMGATATLVVIGIVLFGTELLTWVLGLDLASPEAAHAYPALVVLLLMHWFGSASGPTGSILLMRSSMRMETGNTVAFIVVNLVLNVLLIPPYGVLGAVAATLVSTLIKKGIQIAQVRHAFGFLPWPPAFLAFAAIVGLALGARAIWPEQLAVRAVAALVLAVAAAGFLLPDLRREHAAATGAS